MALIEANDIIASLILSEAFFVQVALTSNVYSLLRAMLVMASRKGLRSSNV